MEQVTPAQFGVKWILELRQKDNPNITVYRTEFDTRDQAVNAAVEMHRGHLASGNDIYNSLLYKVWLVGVARVVDKQFERLAFSLK